MSSRIEATDLWRQGQALCAQGQYKKGLVLMEKAFGLKPAYREPLGSFYFHLYNDLRSGFISSNDFSEAEQKDLWQRGAALLSFNGKNNGLNDNAVANSLKRYPQGEPVYAADKSPRGAYSGGPYEAWYRLEKDFKHHSIFAPANMLEMEPKVEPNPEALKAPVGFGGKLRAVVVPCIIIIIIQAFVYLSILFFSYLGN